MAKKGEDTMDVASIEVELATDRRGAELLSLELRRLAKLRGLEIRSLTVMLAEEHTAASERRHVTCNRDTSASVLIQPGGHAHVPEMGRSRQ